MAADEPEYNGPANLYYSFSSRQKNPFWQTSNHQNLFAEDIDDRRA